MRDCRRCPHRRLHRRQRAVRDHKGVEKGREWIRVCERQAHVNIYVIYACVHYIICDCVDISGVFDCMIHMRCSGSEASRHSFSLMTRLEAFIEPDDCTIAPNGTER
jgi:hypothetical protein